MIVLKDLFYMILYDSYEMRPKVGSYSITQIVWPQSQLSTIITTPHLRDFLTFYAFFHFQIVIFKNERSVIVWAMQYGANNPQQVTKKHCLRRLSR